MNYAANVSGVANSQYGAAGACKTGGVLGTSASWILVLFILLVLLLTCFIGY